MKTSRSSLTTYSYTVDSFPTWKSIALLYTTSVGKYICIFCSSNDKLTKMKISNSTTYYNFRRLGSQGFDTSKSSMWWFIGYIIYLSIHFSWPPFDMKIVCVKSRSYYHCNDIHKYSSHKNVNLNRRAGRTPPTARPSMQQSTRWPPICYPPWLTNGGEWQIWRVYWRPKSSAAEKWICIEKWFPRGIIRSQQ